jgi:hypothetical protein
MWLVSFCGVAKDEKLVFVFRALSLLGHWPWFNDRLWREEKAEKIGRAHV